VTGKVQKWGNSLALRIPKSLAEEIHMKEGSSVEVSVKGKMLVISPVKPGRYRLETLLAQVTPENLHAETDFGGPKGREAL